MRGPFILLSLLLSVQFSQLLYAQESQKRRVIVLTDIEADPDDAESMVRFLAYELIEPGTLLK